MHPGSMGFSRQTQTSLHCDMHEQLETTCEKKRAESAAFTLTASEPVSRAQGILSRAQRARPARPVPSSGHRAARRPGQKPHAVLRKDGLQEPFTHRRPKQIEPRIIDRIDRHDRQIKTRLAREPRKRGAEIEVVTRTAAQVSDPTPPGKRHRTPAG